MIQKFPDFMQPAIYAILFIFTGYIISKLTAAVIGLIFKGKETLSKRVSKLTFWLLWLVFIVLGLSYFPLVESSLNLWHPDNVTLHNMGPVLALATGLFLLVPKDLDVAAKTQKFFNYLKRGNSSSPEFIPKVLSILLLLYATASLHSPQEPVFWIGVFISMMLFAWLISKFAKQIIICFSNDPNFVRIFNCIVFATFMVGSFYGIFRPL